MEHLRPESWAEALALRAERPDALPVAGGTDVMVELNFDRARPPALLDLSRVPELTGWERDGGHIRLGAAEPYTRIVNRLGGPLPGLAAASRTVGSPQIRNRGSVGGNLGSASPAGDAHPPLLASGATVEAASVRGTRDIPADAFFTGVKRNALEPDELIAAVRVPVARGPQRFAKIGTRNAMVIAVCSFALALDVEARTAGTGVGSAAPTPRRAAEAERFLAGELEAGGHWESRAALPAALAREFGALVADAAAPIDDVRGTAQYRRHALAVIARRTLTWAWAELRKETTGCGCHAM
ncbi:MULTISPECIES: FAD binding domain-containing protein [Actinomadura]|uniref:FAD binding domain-containing protein n=1 Tax=Actinomadura yumaensis TaxID=111807 RepID=A0ABW2CUY9_9ACTN|nr:FAD binding domain-containing protein [Actinomadura sp. J1-007]MWK39525.1 xanthine dehydrogenase family protein subunit M [Actinomadura sp. J1-007]